MPRYVFIRPAGRGAKHYHLIASDGTTPLCGRRLASDQWHVATQPSGKLCRYCRKVKYGKDDSAHANEGTTEAQTQAR